MTEPSKRGSSRRKGDDYQDLTALRLALEAYVARQPFEMFLEYEKSGNLDDIVLVKGSEVLAYQVKYAVHPLAVYGVSDFLDPKSPVAIRRFADGWLKLRQQFPNHKIAACLCSNRGLDAALVGLVTENGEFLPEVIEDRKRGNAKQIRSELATASGLDAKSFITFLREFRFILRQPTLQDLELYIRTVLLDKELGLSDDTIFFELKDAIKDNALYSRDAITLEYINSLLEKFQSKLLVPQIFPVNHEHFVEQQDLSNQLDRALLETDSGYLIVTGLPGSGKSTSLTTYFERLDRSKNEVFSYYCFVDVNDNVQRIRVQATSFRENLMSEFHKRYPQVLERRFDYSEGNFLKSLETLGKHFAQANRRFLIFLDGLDHAERLEPEIRDTVVSALPAEPPGGVTIVVGTQELHKWPHFLKRVRECPSGHIAMPLFTKAMSEEYLCNKRGLSGLSYADIVAIHKKCEGLPLYLRYAAETLIASETATDAIAALTPASGGDIRNYYSLLWEEFDRFGMGNARALCAVMACLRFSVHRDEFFRIQQVLERPAFEDSFKCMSHLLRDTEGRLTVFHDSFREFVISQIPDDWSREIRGQIASFLKANQDSPRWFGHVFHYSYEAGDYSYVLDEVTADFVDRALLHCRPSGEILDAIDRAIESAYKIRSIVQLSRLGSLGFRTEERLERNFDRAYLANALLALGREQDVMSFAYSSEGDRWLVEPHTALAVMFKLAEEGKRELGNRLFQVFTDEFRGVFSRSIDEVKAEVTEIARCLGIYSEQMPRALRWLSKFNFSPGTLEHKDPFAPGYAPHLEAYIDSLALFKHVKKWTMLAGVKILFPNELIRYLLIRALARHNHLEELSVALSGYLAQDQAYGGMELAYYAAKIGLEPSQVTAISGPIEAPLTKCPINVSHGDPMLRKYAYSCIVLGYNEDEESYGHLASAISIERTLWAAALRHLLKAGQCIGRSLRSVANDWFQDAVESIVALAQAEKGDEERIAESIELIRDVLPLSIGLLTERVETCYPEKLMEWMTCLQSLRDSLLWTTHFGIGESMQDYSFELTLWETLAKSPAARPGLIPLLNACATTYEASTLLKGGSRSDHFLRLAATMAKCGMRSDADQWLRYGIRSSLIYGYHKDVTLLYLIDVLKLVNLHQPDMGLERCARVLSMVDWMPHLTDGRETKWFAEEVFKAVLALNRWAAFDLIKHFSRTKARWQMQDCLEELLMSVSEGDPEYLWCLTELFCNHFDEDGRHCKQIMQTRRHIVELARQSCSEDIYREFEYRFRHFVLTEITPRHWPDDLRAEFHLQATQNDKRLERTESQPNPPSEYALDGKIVGKDEVKSTCLLSFEVFLQTIDNLKKQNNHFHDVNLIDDILRHHIAVAKGPNDLVPIKEYVKSRGRWQNSSVIETLADRFLEFGDSENAAACYGIAYANRGDSFFPWRHGKKYLAAVASINRQNAETLLLKECYESTHKTGGGYDTPPIAASGLDVLAERGKLEEVFSEFLTHCESMFAQLPPNERYAWLKRYEAPSEDSTCLILDFVINELETPEIDLGARLVRALTLLAVARPDEAIPSIVNRTLESSGRSRRRLLSVLHCIADHVPQSLVKHQIDIAHLLDRNDFFMRQTALRILSLIAESSVLDESVATSIRELDSAYSHNISYPTFRFPTTSSAKFTAFLHRNTLFDFSLQVKTSEKILQVPPGSLIAAIEEKLRDEGWSIDQEQHGVEDDWHGHVHPQGWPVVWITTGFQERAVETLSIALNEAAEKFKLTGGQIDRLWRSIQAVDPEYIRRAVVARPPDIQPLHVTNKETWFAELDALEPIHIAQAETHPDEGDWITVFEKRSLTQEEEYNVPYRQNTVLESCLIPRGIYDGADALREVDFITERIVVPDSEGAITSAQARAILLRKGSALLDEGSHPTIPLIAEHENPITFLGYPHICSLASFIISTMGLSFSNLDLLKNGLEIAVFEVWQEGYQDEAYSREKLSSGARLRVRRALLSEICDRFERLPCMRIKEERMQFSSIHRRDPDDTRQSIRYILFQL